MTANWHKSLTFDLRSFYLCKFREIRHGNLHKLVRHRVNKYYLSMYTETMETNGTELNVTESALPSFGVMRIIQISVSSVGIVSNFGVVVVFLNHKQLRAKIPNRFIVNQVRIIVSTSNKHSLDSNVIHWDLAKVGNHNCSSQIDNVCIYIH